MARGSKSTLRPVHVSRWQDRTENSYRKSRHHLQARLVDYPGATPMACRPSLDSTRSSTSSGRPASRSRLDRCMPMDLVIPGAFRVAAEAHRTGRSAPEPDCCGPTSTTLKHREGRDIEIVRRIICIDPRGHENRQLRVVPFDRGHREYAAIEAKAMDRWNTGAQAHWAFFSGSARGSVPTHRVDAGDLLRIRGARCRARARRGLSSPSSEPPPQAATRRGSRAESCSWVRKAPVHAADLPDPAP